MTEAIEKQLREGGVYVSTTVGVSMKPMLRNRRDRVIIRPVTQHPLRRLDVPLYRAPNGSYILHRIIAVKDGYYIIRGDNTFVKERVSTDAVIGVMTEFYRGKRHVSAEKRSYRLYAAVWHAIYPVRYLWHLLRVAASRILRRLFPKGG